MVEWMKGWILVLTLVAAAAGAPVSRVHVDGTRKLVLHGRHKVDGTGEGRKAAENWVGAR
jgi:hypothetical protein